MRSIVEQVDEFIEGLFDGSILYQDIDINHLANGKIWVSGSDQTSIAKMSVARARLDGNLDDYLREKTDESKKEKAFEIYGAVLTLRTLGVIQTNTHIGKDMQFFKEKCKQLEAENKELLQAYAQAKERINVLSDKPKSDFRGFS